MGDLGSSVSAAGQLAGSKITQGLAGVAGERAEGDGLGGSISWSGESGG